MTEEQERIVMNIAWTAIKAFREAVQKELGRSEFEMSIAERSAILDVLLTSLVMHKDVVWHPKAMSPNLGKHTEAIQ